METQQFQSVDGLKIKVCRALKDQFIINWRDNLQNMSSCDVYINFKTNFVFEKYLVSLAPQLSKTFWAFRLNNTRLPKVVGRYTKTPRDQRYCNLCSNGNFLGDEFHLLLECSNAQICFLRNKYIPIEYSVRPNMQKCIELIRNDNVVIIRKLAMFLKKSLPLFR